MLARVQSSCDRVYQRPRPAGGLVERLEAGTLTAAEARQFWLDEFHDALLHAELIGPRLLHKNASLRVRVEAFAGLHSEWGANVLEQSSAYLIRELLIALDTPADQLGWALDHRQPRIAREAARIKELDGLSLIASAFAAATRASRCYPTLARLLQKGLGLSREAVRYFDVRAADGAAACDRLASSLVMAATTSVQQESALKTIQDYFNEPRARELCNAATAAGGRS